jgi:hypothetical protein
MKRKFAKLSKAEQEKVELEYHRRQPEEFDQLTEPIAKRKRLLEAIDDVEHDRNIVVPDQEQFSERSSFIKGFEALQPFGDDV